jgi:Zn-dependent protease
MSVSSSARDDSRNPASGGWPLFKVSGIRVSIHWTWFLVAVYEIQVRKGDYSSPIWNIAEYLALFGIVLLHEFGHAFACRMTGGKADEIILWPLGGVAFVKPPPRPSALLWSIAAGPMVNALLVPILALLSLVVAGGGADIKRLVHTVSFLNLVLLIFNILPIYPLDGGQILRALLWFLIGPVRSLMVAAVIGILGAVALGFLAWIKSGVWLGIVAVFILLRSVDGLRQAKSLALSAAQPRHQELRCPSCGQSPPCANLWCCDACGWKFDTFESNARCPQCEKRFGWTSCPLCGAIHPSDAWKPPLKHAS